MRGVPTMAVTATATDAVKADVLKMLKIPRARTFKVGVPEPVRQIQICIDACHCRPRF